MHIECLDFFLKIAKMKSISKVANSSHISQSALSQQMQKLEESLGFKLFVRSNRGVELTEWGNIVLKYSDNIIRTYNKMMDELKNQGNNQEIKIEAAWTIATYCLPCALYKMKEKYPSHNYDLVSSSPEKIEQDVLNDICDIGFANVKPSNQSLSCYEVINEKVVLAALPNYDIPEEINLKEILNYPLIVLKGECIIKENLENNLKKIDYSLEDLNIVFTLESTEAVKSLVLKGYGVAFLPYSAVKKELFSKELITVKIPDISLDYSIYLINKADTDLSNPVREFIEGFKNLGNNVCC
ncbi:MAG: hypothetical protein PWR10_1726 [Halanaerobiales bacterium]|nr:hypothetical protein [Halanaerobiales bacterium]